MYALFNLLICLFVVCLFIIPCRYIQCSQPYINNLIAVGCIIALFCVILLGLDGQYVHEHQFASVCHVSIVSLSDATHRLKIHRHDLNVCQMTIFFNHVFTGRYTLHEKNQLNHLQNPIISQILGDKIIIFTCRQLKQKAEVVFFLSALTFN